MAEYIERENAIAWFMPYAHAGESIDADVVIADIKGMKAADVAPVRHAMWDENGRCTNCGVHAPFWCMASTYYKSPWCHECGCKMDL